MNCIDAREAMLTVDQAELRRKGGTELADHLATCAECAGLAEVLVRGTLALRMATARRPEASRRVSQIVAISSAAAAAAIVLAISIDGRGSRDDSSSPARPAPLPVAREVSLEVERGQRATVLKTSDPKVTVIWLSSGEGK